MREATDSGCVYVEPPGGPGGTIATQSCECRVLAYVG